MTYRLFVDIPISGSQEEALKIAKMCMDIISANHANFKSLGIEQINYRLGHDEDRQTRNYFEIDKAGHASTKKSKIVLDSQPEDAIM